MGAVLLFIFCTSSKGKTNATLQAVTGKPQSEELISPHGPTSSVRTIIQDRQGNMWLA